MEKVDMERPKSAVTRPCAELEATAIARTAGSKEKRTVLPCTAATIIRDDAQELGDIHEIRRSKEDNGQLRKELKRNIESLSELLLTFARFLILVSGGK